MAVQVDIIVRDDSVVAAPIAGAVVGVYDSATSEEVAQASTDSDGRAAFLLPGDVYEVRLFKLGVRFSNPARIEVLEPAAQPDTNVFDVSGTLVGELPAAVDPRVCRCTGRFMGFSNQPMAGKLVVITAKADMGTQTPKVVDGGMISQQMMKLRTDADGYVSVDLLRTGEYFVTFAGDDDTVWPIKVPDRSSVNLIDLIHPQPVSLSWDDEVAPGGELSIAVGETVEVPYSVLFSDYENITTRLTQWINFSYTTTGRPAISVGVNPDNKVIIQALAEGSAEITASVKEHLLPIVVPPYTVAAPPLMVTVTP